MNLEKRIKRLEDIKIDRNGDSSAREFFENVIDQLKENEQDQLFDLWKKYEDPPIPFNHPDFNEAPKGTLNDLIEEMSSEDKMLHNIAREDLHK